VACSSAEAGRALPQVTINCAERGLLLLRVRDELRMTTTAYQVRLGGGVVGVFAHEEREVWAVAAGVAHMSARICAGCAAVRSPPEPGQFDGVQLTASCLVRLPTRAAPQTLYESSVAFGMRKALLAEQGKGDMAARIEALEGAERDLARQVAEWKLKCEAVEKREGERREAEAKKHKEEVAYLESYARQLKGQLEALTSTAGKKAAGGAG
jgi:hypothetical protein